MDLRRIVCWEVGIGLGLGSRWGGLGENARCLITTLTLEFDGPPVYTIEFLFCDGGPVL